jgi:hypothetical protein
MKIRSYKLSRIVIVAAFVLTFAPWGYAQVIPQKPPQPNAVQFIDLDGDGINDTFQRGLGIQSDKRQRSAAGHPGKFPVGLQRPVMATGSKYQGSIDQAITQRYREMLNCQFGIMDQTGNGIPDAEARSSLKLFLNSSRQWKTLMLERLNNGQPPWIDANEDGIPDGQPPRYQWRHQPPHSHTSHGAQTDISQSLSPKLITAPAAVELIKPTATTGLSLPQAN